MNAINSIINVLLCCYLIRLTNGQLFGIWPPIINTMPSHQSNKPAFGHEDREMNEQPESDNGKISSSSAKAELIRCKQDADCIDDNSSSDNLMFCDVHYGFCDTFRQEGELCRKGEYCRMFLQSMDDSLLRHQTFKSWIRLNVASK